MGEQPAVSASVEEPPTPGLPDLSLFSLFPTVEEQIESIAQAQAEDHQTAQQHISTPAGLVPSAVIGRALTSGGNEKHSIERIVAFFQKGPTGSAAASFMKKEFGEGGKGVTIGGQEYSLWFNSEGFRIAPGRSAFGPDTGGRCASSSAVRRRWALALTSRTGSWPPMTLTAHGVRLIWSSGRAVLCARAT